MARGAVTKKSNSSKQKKTTKTTPRNAKIAKKGGTSFTDENVKSPNVPAARPQKKSTVPLPKSKNKEIVEERVQDSEVFFSFRHVFFLPLFFFFFFLSQRFFIVLRAPKTLSQTKS
jgi:hypothetical protein